MGGGENFERSVFQREGKKREVGIIRRRENIEQGKVVSIYKSPPKYFRVNFKM